MLNTIKKTFRDKYRLFLFTQVPGEKCPELTKAKEAIAKNLVDTGLVQEHRVMFASTLKGRESQVR